jgi:hypothetical protein
VARHAERHPLGRSRHDLDAVAPPGRVHGGANHVGDLDVVERRRETGEHVAAHGFDQLLMRRDRSEDDDLEAGLRLLQFRGER